MIEKEKTLNKIRKARDDELLRLEAEYCSWTDTVHYAPKLNIFNRAEGVYLYDKSGTQYLGLQMWYSAANFGYKNPRLYVALKRHCRYRLKPLQAYAK